MVLYEISQTICYIDCPEYSARQIIRTPTIYVQSSPAHI